MEIFSIVIRTIFFYFFISLAYRIMGKREIGQLGIIDLIVSLLIAELVAISIENLDSPIYLTMIPIIILVFLEISLAYLSLKNKSIRLIIEGKPSLVISNGHINYHELVKQRYTLDDLLLALRTKGIRDILEVEYAFLEANGNLSVFKYKPFRIKGSYPLPLIVDGTLDKNTLKKKKKEEPWFDELLLENNLDIKEIFYAFCKGNKIYFIKKRS